MKILCLNTEDASTNPQKLRDFLVNNTNVIDIFCLQEVFEKMETLSKEILPNYNVYREKKRINENGDLKYSLAIFIRKDIQVIGSKSFGEDNPKIGAILSTNLIYNNKPLTIFNVHGVCYPSHKMDCPERLEQSKILIDSLNIVGGSQIVVGDFNLYPNTESIKTFEENGYKDLIKECNIKNTRNNIAWKRYPDNKQFYSDYAFVTPDIKVLNFDVPYNEVSDHLPLILDVDF
jgi:endonuclease/exonuclease/phosphatase family metal-dependent hydrolase